MDHPMTMLCRQPLFSRALTVVLAILDADGDFLEFRYDGRRFEPLES
jgi:hypothetical protein